MTSGLRATPHRLNTKLFPGEVQAWGGGRTRAWRELLLWVSTDPAPPENRTAGVAGQSQAVGHERCTGLQLSWKAGTAYCKYRQLYRFR